MKKLIAAAILTTVIVISNSNAQSWGFNQNNRQGYYNNNYQPTYIAAQYYVAPYGVTQQQRYNTPGPIIIPSYAPSYKSNQILIRPF